MGWNLFGGLMSPIANHTEEKERRHSGDSGNASQEEYEALDNEDQEIPANQEGSYDIIPKNLTFAEIINILNQAVREDDCEELDKVVQNIEDYEGRSITLDTVNFKDFCEQQLNLDLQNNRHIYSNILSQYKFDQEEFKYDYSVKELVLLAIAANDKLTERYQDILFIEENLSLLPLLVGGQKYIEAFIEKFHGTDGVYGRLKDQAIQLVEPNKIDFFSVIALRKEQELLNAVFVEYVLRDFGQVLKTSKPDPLYGVLETASLIKNEEFITIVLGAFERYINEPTKKASTEELLKKSFATLLETAISQEHISVIKYLCKRYTNSAGHAIYDVYEQAFADDKVITILRQQILKNIGARGRKEICDLILKTALDADNVTFIEHLYKECAKCSNDVINYPDHKSKNNEFDNIHESILIALSNVKNTNTSDILSENPGPENSGSQQPQKNILDKRKNVMDNIRASVMEHISNDCEGGGMFGLERNELLELHQGGRGSSGEQQKDTSIVRPLNGFHVESVAVPSTDTNITQKAISLLNSNKITFSLFTAERRQKLAEVTKFREVNSTDAIAGTSNAQNLQVATSGVQQVVPFKNNANEFTVHISEIAQKFLSAGISKTTFSASTTHAYTLNWSKLTKANPGEHQGLAEILMDLLKKGAFNGRSVTITHFPAVKALEQGGSNGVQPNDPGVGDEDTPPVMIIAEVEDTEAFVDATVTTSEEAGSNGLSVASPVTETSSEQVNNVQTSGVQPSNQNNGNATGAQNTKGSKWPVIVASALVLAGIISGVAVAVYLEMLAVGIAVGACCLVAAAVIYCCRPSNSLENSNAAEVAKTAMLM